MRISDWSSDVCSSDLLSFVSPGLSTPIFTVPSPFTSGWLAGTQPSSPMQDSLSSPAGSAAPSSPVEVSSSSFPQAVAMNASARSGAIHRSLFRFLFEIGRASCRERVCQYVLVSVGAVTLKKKKRNDKKQDTE